MGLTILVNEVGPVFTFLTDFFSCIPLPVRTLVFASFGSMVFLAVMKSIWR